MECKKTCLWCNSLSGLLLVLVGVVPPCFSQEVGEVELQEQAALPEAMAVNTDPQIALMTVVEPKLESVSSPMDDSYDPATGNVTFAVTDVSLPGNSAIPVELSRWVPNDDADTGGPTGWAWNIPFIRGHYLAGGDASWDWGPGMDWHAGKNCTGGAGGVVTGTGDYVGGGYWKGKHLHIPGVTSEIFLNASSGQQITKSNFKVVSCIPIAGGQEGFVVAGPDGFTYTFNQVKDYRVGAPAYRSPSVYVRLIMISKIEDRFGNYVNYSYDNGELIAITASDGRAITINLELSGSGRRPLTVVAGGRVWTYLYQAPYGSPSDDLLYVNLPDGAGRWKYEGLSAVAFKPNGIGGYNQQLRLQAGLPYLIPGCTVATGDHVVSITSPAGMLATYLFRDTIHYRSNVEPYLYSNTYDSSYVVSRSTNCTISRSLISKSISGPAVAASWSYQYSGNRGTYTASSGLNGFLVGPFDLSTPTVGGYPKPITVATAVNYRSTTISGPDRRVVFYIDRNSGSISENRVIAEDVLDASATQLLQRTEYAFSEGHFVGDDGLEGPANDKQLNYRINPEQVVVLRQGRRFLWKVDATCGVGGASLCFDSFDRPTKVIQGSAPSP